MPSCSNYYTADALHGIVQAGLGDALQHGACLNTLPDKIAAQVKEAIGSPGFTVPIIDHELSPIPACGTLLKLRCMIQDMPDPAVEFYFLKYDIQSSQCADVICSRTMLYSNRASVPSGYVFSESDETNVFGDRRLFHCISIPALSDWIKQPFMGEAVIASEIGTVKRLKTNCGTNLGSSHRVPIPEQPWFNFIVKVYKNGEEIKLNDCVEFLGFFEPDRDEPADNDGDCDSLRCFHAISFSKLQHNNPLVPQDFESVKKDRFMWFATSVFQHIRTSLVDRFTHFLLGDTLAAEYLLCHLISQVHKRQDDAPIGKLALNLFNVPGPPSYGRELYAMISSFVAKACYLPLTLDGLNNHNFIPMKDFADREELVSGRLQLSDGTHLFVDETVMSSGQLNEKGLKNLAALNRLIKLQSQSYDFKFYSCDFYCDIPVLIISEGKSMLTADCSLPLVSPSSWPHDHFSLANIPALTNELTELLRAYLTNVKFTDYEILGIHSEFIQKEFVEMRKDDPTVTGDDLNILLVLTRLISLSNASNMFTETAWNQAKQMETERKKRLLNLTST